MSAEAVIRPLADVMPALESLYRDLHAHPELAYAEQRTAGVVAARLRDAGYEVSTGIGVTGVVGVLRNGPGPTVVLRADMDALPVEEQTGLGYASTATTTGPNGESVPLMHACGHDVHMTWLIGAAELLACTREPWSGTVVALFQPAEEGAGGAKRMIADDVFAVTGQPDVILGQHVFPLPAGTIAYRSGEMMAAADAYDIKLFGRAAHGSLPQFAVDPVVLAAATVTRLQTIVAREVAPHEDVVLTVGRMHAGATGNIIAEHADLTVCVRTFDEAVGERVIGAIRRIVEAECRASGTHRPPEFTETVKMNVLVNDEAATERVVGGLRAQFGDAAVREMPRFMGSEDFGEFGTACGAPSVFWLVGGTDPEVYAAAQEAQSVEAEIPVNHSPRFAPVMQPTLTIGVTTLVAAAMEWLGDA
jgi:amidohydrolase